MYDDLVTVLPPPPKRLRRTDGEHEHHLYEGAVMLAYAMHLLNTAPTKEVRVHPDGQHLKQFDFSGWLEHRRSPKTRLVTGGLISNRTQAGKWDGRMIKTIRPSGDDLDCIFYEIWMMTRAFEHLSGASPGVSKNAFLESFLLHLRNLIYFLKGPQRPTDLTYRDFKDKNGNPVKPSSHSITEADLKAINQHLQHITKVRLNQKISWPSELLLQEMNRAIADFLNQLPDRCFPTTEGRRRDDFLRQLAPLETITVSIPVASTTTTTETTTLSSVFPSKKPPTKTGRS